MANKSSDWFLGTAAFFVKIRKNKSGMPSEFCWFVIGGKEMLLYLITCCAKLLECYWPGAMQLIRNCMSEMRAKLVIVI